MSEEAEMWEKHNSFLKERKKNNKVFSIDVLDKNNINYVSRNDEILLIVENKYNFYPTTGKITTRQGKDMGRGVYKLLKLLKNK